MEIVLCMFVETETIRTCFVECFCRQYNPHNLLESLCVCCEEVYCVVCRLGLQRGYCIGCIV